MYYLVAPGGIPNFGDEQIVATWLRHLAEIAPDADVVLDCLNPAGVTAAVRAVHPRLRLTNVLWQLCMVHWNAGPAAAELVGDIVASPGRSRLRIDDAESLDLLRRAAVVHLLGGGYLNGIWPAYLGLPGGAAAAARCSGGRAVMTGQGLSPAPNGAAGLLRDLLGRFDLVDVRDSPSAELAGEDASCSGDDVFLGLGAPARPAGDSPEMMVSVQSLLSHVGVPETVRMVERAVAAWKPADVGLLECSPREDRELLDLLEAALPAVRRYSLAEVLSEGLPAAAGQCWLSTRFHPHLFAAAAGASGVAVDINADYYGTKHRSLVAYGSRWQVVDGPVLTARPMAGGFPPEALRTLRAAKRAVADRIYPAPGVSVI
ncbi:polysaccharide pyruvyl transferase family protein [Actinoplanes sp. NPDC051411]|uniref:polysaccharide pyruvyl transferase family protein n=1 Tax=Actinoplanes sp. NPDC051411 TaxID=3155522 RepID=UPI0034370B37